MSNRDGTASTTVELRPGETADQRMAEMEIAPNTRAAVLHHSFAGVLFGPRAGKPDQRAPVDAVMKEIAKLQKAAASGDMTRASDLLITQASVLDAAFGDLMVRAVNAISNPDAVRVFMGMALKAQAQSRATVEALARMHQPREQVVRHVHVNEGGRQLSLIKSQSVGLGVETQKSPINPLHPEPEVLRSAPRCLARTRSGKPCQSPAVRGKRRCRMHGGTNPGAPRGNRNAFKHGRRSAEMVQLAALIRALT